MDNSVCQWYYIRKESPLSGDGMYSGKGELPLVIENNWLIVFLYVNAWQILLIGATMWRWTLQNCRKLMRLFE